MNNNEKRTLWQDVRLVARAVGIWQRLLPTCLPYQICSCLVNGIKPYFPLYMSAALINELAGSCDGQRLLLLAAITVVGSFLLSLSSRFLRGRLDSLYSLTYSRHEALLMDAENRFQYAHLEDPELVLQRKKIVAVMNATSSGLQKVIEEFEHTLTRLLEVIVSASLTASLFYTVAQGEFRGVFAFVNSPWAALALAALIGVNAWVAVRLSNGYVGQTENALSELARENTRYAALARAKGADVYMFKLNDLVLAEYKNFLLRPKWVGQYERANIRYSSWQAVQRILLQLVVFLFTAAKAWMGAVGIGSFVLYQGTVERFVTAVSELAAYVGELRYNNRFLQNTFDYLDMPNGMYQGSLAVEKREDIDYEIEFRDVSFRYPRSESWVLRHVNLKFKIGDKLAIVGENGSGKSTFIKLLCRLYDPTEGKILLNGIDITRYRYDEYMALFSVAFQDFSLFAFSIAENVAAGAPFDAQRVQSCLERVGLAEKIAGLKKGIDTNITREYENDGMDFSGGEKQKMALARALYKDAPFMILDEPTAALDPLAEAEIYARFNDIASDKTSVFISHRLSSCRFCDEIAVFHKGEIVQRGSHDALLAQADGKYAQLWRAQAQYYTGPEAQRASCERM